MIEMQISVTEAARNFADCVNSAHYQQQSFVLLKNGVPFARLFPRVNGYVEVVTWRKHWHRLSFLTQIKRRTSMRGCGLNFRRDPALPRVAP